MAKTSNPAEFNTFVGGLITEASPLTFPENASIDEVNFVLNRDGSRQRRLGMNLEAGWVGHQMTNTIPSNGVVAVTSVNWENAGGEVGRWISVVQIGQTVKFFDASAAVLSSSLIYTYTFNNITLDQKLSYAVVDGILVIASGERNVYIFEYEAGSITVYTKNLLVRDLFGVEDLYSGRNLRQGTDIAFRPDNLTDAHLYNLRNQTWGPTRPIWNNNAPQDPISRFYMFTKTEFPSNADSVNHALSKRADWEPSTTDRFRPEDIALNPVGTFSAAKGYFIIDAMARGSSRISEIAKLKARFPSIVYEPTGLPQDETPGGPSVVCEYAGRVWFTGFSGQIIDGDDHSPRMVSYILFSQLVDSPADIINCFQEGDPTSTEEPELVDNDGGFIRIEGAYGICKLVNVGNAVIAVAANGIWMIQGGSDYGFTATNYLVTKLSEHGSTSPNSVVVIDNTFMYWGADGIYHLTRNQYGDYVANNLTEKTIQKYYEAIPSVAREQATGFYDSYDKKVKWIYNNIADPSMPEVTELVFDVALAAFYPSVLNKLPILPFLMPCGSVKLPPYKLEEITEEVDVNGVLVTVNGDPVNIVREVRTSSIRETKYIITFQFGTGLVMTFGGYTDETFTDWVGVGGSDGVDAAAYLITGYLSGADFQREKWVPYITFHFKKTENGFVEDSSGDWVPTNPSSCLVQSQWAWTNSALSGKWGRVWQAYRHRRQFFPTGLDDEYEDGYSVVETKSKLRGNGKVLSLKIVTEPLKDLHIYGWSMIADQNGTI